MLVDTFVCQQLAALEHELKLVCDAFRFCVALQLIRSVNFEMFWEENHFYSDTLISIVVSHAQASRTALLSW